jgi:transposase-like protein
MEHAVAVYHAETASDAHTGLAEWNTQWHILAPQSVAHLERDCGQTLVFSHMSGLALQWIRTMSLLERTNRE